MRQEVVRSDCLALSQPDVIAVGEGVRVEIYVGTVRIRVDVDAHTGKVAAEAPFEIFAYWLWQGHATAHQVGGIQGRHGRFRSIDSLAAHHAVILFPLAGITGPLDLWLRWSDRQRFGAIHP